MQQIGVIGGSVAAGFNQVAIASGFLACKTSASGMCNTAALNVYLYVPMSQLVAETNIGASNVQEGNCNCVTFFGLSPDTAPPAAADLSRFENAVKASKNRGRLKALAFENGIRASKNVASLLYGIRVTRTRLLASVTERNGKGAKLQAAMLAALDGELAGWLEDRSVRFRVLASVLRAQHGAKRTAALTKVLDLQLPDALFVKAVHSLTRAEVLSIVDALRAQHKISQASATALSKAADRRAQAAFVRAARATPFSVRLLLDMMSTAI